VRQVRDLVEDLMANSTASIIIKRTATFNRGDTSVFGSWVYTADSAGLLQHYLTMTPDPETGLVTLPEVVTNHLIEKFGEFSLCNQVTDFKLGSTSNSTSPWIVTCEPEDRSVRGLVDGRSWL
jgi:hypothetical protein